jgi:hypothetical protein
MTFNRPAFERLVAERSSLSPEQFDRMLGGEVTAENKAIAWQLLQLEAKHQYAVWQVVKAFPEAHVEKVKCSPSSSSPA